VLAADVGGTKTLFGLFRAGRLRPIPLKTARYATREGGSLEAIAQRFLADHPADVASACLGVPGPVLAGTSEAANLPWKVSQKALQRRFGWKRVRLVNDLAAMAMAVPLLAGREVAALNRRRIQRRAPMALVAPGTGLGQALLTWHHGRYHALPSEGGHADFAPNSDIEIRLWRHLHRRFGHVSVERVLSGPGLVNIYRWLQLERGGAEARLPREPEEGLAAAVTRTALADRGSVSAQALDLYVSILGAVAGNLALTGLCTGGVYLGGGIPPKILPFLRQGRLLTAFKAKGRLQAVLDRIAVRVILNERAALLGAARCALSDVP
jgi:glucokinase